MINGYRVSHPIWRKGEYIYINQVTMELKDEQGQKFNWNFFWNTKTAPKWQKNWIRLR